jgi:hypothetical protein
MKERSEPEGVGRAVWAGCGRSAHPPKHTARVVPHQRQDFIELHLSTCFTLLRLGNSQFPSFPTISFSAAESKDNAVKAGEENSTNYALCSASAAHSNPCIMTSLHPAILLTKHPKSPSSLERVAETDVFSNDRHARSLPLAPSSPTSFSSSNIQGRSSPAHLRAPGMCGDVVFADARGIGQRRRV